MKKHPPSTSPSQERIQNWGKELAIFIEFYPMADKKELIYVHVPRTAGSSLDGFCKHIHAVFIGHDIRNENYTSLDAYLNASGGEKFIFTFIRNPWDRVVSAFHYLNSGGNCAGDAQDREKYLDRYRGDFNLFVKSAFQWRRKILKQIHFRPQYTWLSDRRGKLLPHFIGKYENFDEEFDRLCKILQTEHYPLPQKNRSEHENYRSYYDKKSVDLIARAYRKDINLFSFHF